jgi:hypothetical protein
MMNHVYMFFSGSVCMLNSYICINKKIQMLVNISQGGALHKNVGRFSYTHRSHLFDLSQTHSRAPAARSYGLTPSLTSQNAALKAGGSGKSPDAKRWWDYP